MDDQRTVAWFSCGASSAVAAKMVVGSCDHVEVVYCDTMSAEHPDNERFFRDVERWIGRKITVIKSDDYCSVDDVFEKESFMSGPRGARCTIEMKKIPRFKFQKADDIHVFGFCAEETSRIKRFEQSNHDLNLRWILRDNAITKEMCFQKLQDAGIQLPAMYALGYKNNNCLGCVKATSARYWNKVRDDFPDVFKKRAEQSRRIGCRLVRINGIRAFLDELPETDKSGEEETISCGPECSYDLFANQE